ncbi:MAG: helix-turn-helix domain-containing protein [Acidobacteriota bacterium]|nr:helix-turn-helix domain-containing protein [Acidobacteriota bacterium]
MQSRDTLLSEVRGYSSGVDSRTVDTHVRRLRHKLLAESERIETVIGVGYRFRV